MRLIFICLSITILFACGNSEEKHNTNTSSENTIEQDAQKFCDCAKDFAALIPKMNEDPTLVSPDEFKKVGGEFEKCIAELDEKYINKDLSETKALDEAVSKACPDIARVMNE